MSLTYQQDILTFLKQNWSGKHMAVRGQLFDLSILPGYIALHKNTQALAFYHKVGFKHYQTHLDAVALARALKPSIPLEVNGIPIKDEIELRKELT